MHYIDSLELKNLRTFVDTTLTFIHPRAKFRPLDGEGKDIAALLPQPRLPNVNLLLGDNGSGKSTVLQAIALASLGPAAPSAQLPLLPFVRFAEGGDYIKKKDSRMLRLSEAKISAMFQRAGRDDQSSPTIESRLGFLKKKELEELRFVLSAGAEWDPVYDSWTAEFFCVAYSALRHADAGESRERESSQKQQFRRGKRLQSVFQDSFPLFPMTAWLPAMREENPVRYREISGLIDRLLGQNRYRFVDDQRDQGNQFKRNDYLFERGKLQVPFRSMSDGYRAFIAWVSDLLYHLASVCPQDKQLTEIPGMVLVDEIDLHLHPEWQMEVVPTVANTFPALQFIFTSHSPLIAGSLEWMNITALNTDEATNQTVVSQPRESVHGLDADQILKSEFFGLASTIAPAKRQQLEEITNRIRAGDKDAPLQLIRALSTGMEAGE